MNYTEQWALAIVGAIIVFLLLFYLFAKVPKIAKSIPKDSTASVVELPEVEVPISITSTLISRLKEVSLISIVAVIAAIIVLTVIALQYGPEFIAMLES